MKYETIIDATIARDHLGDPSWAFVDCRFFLAEPERGAREYASSHVAGAVYAHLDRDLSGPVTRGVTGRHPLPSPEALARTLGALGIGPGTQVVAYDESSGAMAAARLWWLLTWAGHDAAAVLDGGLKGWQARGLPTASGIEKRPEASFTVRVRPQMTVDAAGVLAAARDPLYVVLDARTNDRYRGMNETVDPVAGHIPGALSAPYADSMNEDGSFRSPRELAEAMDRLAGNRDAQHTIFYCGSGVTAAHRVLACAHAGKGIPLLYPGSWSEWITDPQRPVARAGT
jgi:thiosulfate/3-mercaptopyruvate sulfurtransferase